MFLGYLRSLSRKATISVLRSKFAVQRVVALEGFHSRSNNLTEMQATQAATFTEKILGVTDATTRESRDRLEFLNEIIEKYHNKVPFHNLDLLSRVAEKRKAKLPSLDEIVTAGLAAEGGLCFSQNVFLNELIKSLGYKTELKLCSVYEPGAEDHVVIIARDVVETGNLFVIEGGFGTPSFVAVPMALADGEYTAVYEHSVQPFRYVRRGDTYIRQHKVMPDEKPLVPRIEDGWNNVYTFTLESYEYEALEKALDTNVYSNPGVPFQRVLYVAGWTNNKMTTVKNDTLKVENDRQQMVTTKNMESAEETKMTIFEHFPMIPPRLVESGVDYWFTNCRKETKP